MTAEYIFILSSLAVMIGLLIVYGKEVAQRAIDEINNFRGGPPGPMGPLPSTDAHLLLRRLRKESTPL